MKKSSHAKRTQNNEFLIKNIVLIGKHVVIRAKKLSRQRANQNNRYTCKNVVVDPLKLLRHFFIIACYEVACVFHVNVLPIRNDILTRKTGKSRETKLL